MDFNLWKEIGTEFMLKSNIVNWYACTEGTGSFVHWRSGSIKCRMVKNQVNKCLNVVPDTFTVMYYIAKSNMNKQQLLRVK